MMPSKTVFEMSAVASLLLLLLPLAASHVIGGGINTDFSITRQTNSIFSDMSQMSVLDLMSYYVAHESHRDSGRNRHQHNSLHGGKTASSQNKKSHSEVNHRVHDFHPLESWAAGRNTLGHVNSWNELFRSKRHAQCSWPRLTKTNVQRLNPHVNVEAIFRFNREDDDQVGKSAVLFGNSFRTNRPSSQKCPSVVIERDLGSDIFPRYIRDVKCSSDSVSDSSCHNMTQNVNVYKKVGCSKGEAVTTTVRMTVHLAVC